MPKTLTKHEGDTPDNVILVGYSGSHAYGLTHTGYTDPISGEQMPPSDEDIRGVFVEPTESILSLGVRKQLVEQRLVDTNYDEIERFMVLCLAASPGSLDVLGSPITFNPPDGYLLLGNADIFVSRKVGHSYQGYAVGQDSKAKKRTVHKTKPMMHAIRALLTGKQILKEGYITVGMSEHRDLLLSILFGEMRQVHYSQLFDKLLGQLVSAETASKLPIVPDRTKANEILLQIRRNNLGWD